MNSQIKNMAKDLHILYIEDEDGIRSSIANTLNMIFGQVSLAVTAEEGLNIFSNLNPDIILTDIKLPQLNGIDFIGEVRKVNQQIPIIILSAFTDHVYLFEGFSRVSC